MGYRNSIGICFYIGLVLYPLGQQSMFPKKLFNEELVLPKPNKIPGGKLVSK